MSLLNIVIAYLYCICLLHIFIAYPCCISVKHIYIAYLFCRVAVFCWLSLVSMFGRFGGVFVRFLVVLGGLRGVLEALLGVLVSPTSSTGLVGNWGRVGLHPLPQLNST